MKCLLLLPLLALSGAAVAVPPRLPPHDYCTRDRSFVAFRRALNEAVARRDAAFILRMADDDIRYSYGDSSGREGFARFWHLDRPATSGLWRELRAALSLGCVPDEGSDFVMPGMNQVGDEDMDTDYTLLLVAVRPGAALRRRPSDSSPIIARLRWDVVTLDARRPQGEWAAARLADGRRGFVRRSLFRSFGDYYAVFTRKAGRWRMISFIAGD